MRASSFPPAAGAAVALSCILVSGPVSGATPSDVRNSDIGSVRDAAVVHNPDQDEFFVVWESIRHRELDEDGNLIGHEREIFGQRIDASTGSEIGTNDLRISDAGGLDVVDYSATHPHVAYNPAAGEYLVVWMAGPSSGPTTSGSATRPGSASGVLFRGPTVDGPWTQVEPDLVPGAGTSTEPTSYVWQDPAPDETETWYRLESVAEAGTTDDHGRLEPRAGCGAVASSPLAAIVALGPLAASRVRRRS